MLLDRTRRKLLLNYFWLLACISLTTTQGPRIYLGCIHFRNEDTWNLEGEVACPSCHPKYVSGWALDLEPDPGALS